MPNFEPGTRVKLSAGGLKQFNRWGPHRVPVKTVDVRGTVLHRTENTHSHCSRIKFDDHKEVATNFAEAFLEVAND